MSSIFTGWGLDPNKQPCHLKATKQKFMTNFGLCQPHGHKWFICGFAKGHSVCSGDSGGPLTVNENGVHVVVGVVASNWGCSGNRPALFTRVTTFLPWIRENIKDGDCGGN